MTAATREKFDANRAVAILNTAKKHGLYPAPLPESDQDKIMEAEGIVAQAEQAAQVAETVGKGKVPHYDAVMEVLFEAQVTGGSEPDRHPESAGPPPEPTDEERAVAASMPHGEEEPSDEEIIEARFEPQATWASDDDSEWVIAAEPTNLEVEVHPVGSEEKTRVPLGFLKRKIADPPGDGSSVQQPPQQQEPQPASPSPTQDSPPLSEGGSSPGETTEPPSSPPPSSEQQPAEQPSQSAPSSDVPVDDDEGDQEYRSLLDRVEADYNRAGLPLPADVADPPSMPEDLSTLQDVLVQKLHSQFNSCAARAHYLMGLERQKKIGCSRMRHVSLKPAMRTAREKLGKEASVTEVTHEAEDHPAVVKWIEREQRHSDREAAYKDLFQIYTENVSVLSRDWTMRSSEEAGS
jgi:hypothetical protein